MSIMPCEWQVVGVRWTDDSKTEVIIDADDGNSYISRWPLTYEYRTAVLEYLKSNSIKAQQ